MIKKLLEYGVNFFDTAENYWSGQSETNLGTVLKELNVKRESVVVTTKLYKIIEGKLFYNSIIRSLLTSYLAMSISTFISLSRLKVCLKKGYILQPNTTTI